ncbi:MAG: hypothetical protein WAM66_04220 [Acidobacteriaceae bacterium]
MLFTEHRRRYFTSAAQAATAESRNVSAAENKREHSTIAFPYMDLEDGIKIAKAVYELHGSSCQVETIAGHLKESPTSSSFRSRIAAAKTFGLVTTAQGSVTLTKLGSQICDPQQEKAARVEAFLSVELYKAVYEKFRSVALPPTAGLESALVTLGVAQKQKERARQVLQRSAQQAGFFQFGNDRLVLPAVKPTPLAPPGPNQSDLEIGKEDKKNRGGDGDGRHPLIDGLIKALPPPGSEWAIEARRKWLQAAAMNFDYVYTDPKGEEKSIKVSTE